MFSLCSLLACLNTLTHCWLIHQQIVRCTFMHCTEKCRGLRVSCLPIGAGKWSSSWSSLSDIHCESSPAKSETVCVIVSRRQPLLPRGSRLTVPLTKTCLFRHRHVQCDILNFRRSFTYSCLCIVYYIRLYLIKKLMQTLQLCGSVFSFFWLC